MKKYECKCGSIFNKADTRNIMLTQMCPNCGHEMYEAKEEEENEDNRKFIHDYEQKKLLVADFVNYAGEKIHIIIINDNLDVLYEGGEEYLAYTEEGVAHELCGKVVEYCSMGTHVINGTHFGCIVLYLEKE